VIQNSERQAARRVIVRKPRGIATASKTRASVLRVGLFQKLERNEHRVIAAILYFVLDYDLPPLDVALVS
jgi:hypothetical protein